MFISKEENQRTLILFGVSTSLGLHFHPICRQVFGDAYSDSELRNIFIDVNSRVGKCSQFERDGYSCIIKDISKRRVTLSIPFRHRSSKCSCSKSVSMM